MIRVRLRKEVREDELVKDGYSPVMSENGIKYYTKSIGKLEIQIKKSFPSNVRIKDWDDNRVPWILMKFLLDLEGGLEFGDQIKIWDKGRYYILPVNDTLEMIKELNKFTDICKRLRHWYNGFLCGEFKV
jgi:hypothetical protein